MAVLIAEVFHNPWGQHYNRKFGGITHHKPYSLTKVFTYLVTAFGKGSRPGREEVLRHEEAIPHDITALTFYGGSEIVQYEIRNHEGWCHICFLYTLESGSLNRNHDAMQNVFVSFLAAEHWMITSDNYEDEFYHGYLNILNINSFEFKLKACTGAVILFKYVKFS